MEAGGSGPPAAAAAGPFQPDRDRGDEAEDHAAAAASSGGGAPHVGSVVSVRRESTAERFGLGVHDTGISENWAFGDDSEYGAPAKPPARPRRTAPGRRER